MSNFMNKMLNFAGFDTEDSYDDGYYMEEQDDSVEDYDTTSVFDRISSRRSSRVVKLHEPAEQSQMKVVVVQPESFEEARDITNHLKGKKPVVVNLEMVDKAVARRIVDFLSGSVYALDGDIEKVSNGIFLIAPHNVGILGEEFTSKGSFPWEK